MGRDDEIRRMAYDIWMREGRPEGRALDHWRRAERTWVSQHGTPPQSTQATEQKGQPVASPPRPQTQSSAGRTAPARSVRVCPRSIDGEPIPRLYRVVQDIANRYYPMKAVGRDGFDTPGDSNIVENA